MTDVTISLYPVNPTSLEIIPGSTALVLELAPVLRGPPGDVATIAFSGPISSIGNLTSITSKSGTGTTFVFDTNPVIIGSIQVPNVIGSNSESGILNLTSTNNGTKGLISFGTSGYSEYKNFLGIGNNTPNYKLHIGNPVDLIGTASTAISSSYYLGVGYDEWGLGSFRLIGFGWANKNIGYPAYIGFQETSTAGYTYGDLIFGLRLTTSGTTPNECFRITNSGKIGIANKSPSNDFSFGGNAVRKIDLERHTIADTPGNNLFISAGGATPAATNKNGGQLILSGGVSTGNGRSGVTLVGYISGPSGSADTSQQDMVKVLGNALGFYNASPILKPVVSGSKVSGAALASLLTALNNLGLITDSTTE